MSYVLPHHRHLSSRLLIEVSPRRGFSSPQTSTMLADRLRNRDINGDGVGLVVSRTGWRYADVPFLATARAPDVMQAIAAGWAAPIRWGKESSLGVNLSYATMEGFEGHGLARASVAAAFLRLCAEHPASFLGPVNIQCDQDNVRSIALAQSLGLTRNRAADFIVPKLGRSYLGFACAAIQFEEAASSILATSCEELADEPALDSA